MIQWFLTGFASVFLVGISFMAGYKTPSVNLKNPVIHHSTQLMNDALKAIEQAHQINNDQFGLFKAKQADSDFQEGFASKAHRIHKSL